MTSRNTATFGNSSTVLADQTLAAAGATGTRTDTFSTKANLVGVLLALKPARPYGYDPRQPHHSHARRGLTDDARLRPSQPAQELRHHRHVRLQRRRAPQNKTSQAPRPNKPGTSPKATARSRRRHHDYVTGPCGLPLEQINGTTVLYYHQDQLGSARSPHRQRWQHRPTYTYDSYGKLTAASAPPRDALRIRRSIHRPGDWDSVPPCSVLRSQHGQFLPEIPQRPTPEACTHTPARVPVTHPTLLATARKRSPRSHPVWTGSATTR